MQLSDEFLAAIDAEGGRFTPPHPPRRTAPIPFWKIMKLYRENIIAVFSENDFRRPIIHDRYLALDVFTVNDPALVQETFQTKHEIFQRKTPQMRHALAPLLGDGLFVSDSETWKRRRGAVGPIIHTSKVRSFSPLMCETAVEWREHWREMGDGAQVNVLAEMAELTAEIISRTVFGRRLGREHTGEIVAGFAEYQKHIDQMDLPSVLGLPDWFPRPRGLKVGRALRRVHGVIDDIVTRFEQGRGDAEAVIGQLFAAREEGADGLDREAIRNEAIVIFMAGHETTANTLAWAWYLISQSGRVRDKLHAELAEVLQGRAPEIDDVRRLTYTRAIIEETLRLYPPVPILGRQALADGDINGTQVKRGAVVMVSPFMLHRKPDLWSRPDEFIPERFDDRLTQRPSKYSYIPFAIGPRICPGLTFGLTEAILCLATLAQDFELELEPGHEVRTQCRLTLRPGDTLPMRLHRRAAAAEAPA
ncbi:cytochrome P450 [Oceanicella sp. SM1341]|uniref:cytochrome P450 n=1 Tax=Oceanicella sp. SM1341 TaxID=1548889 RepID=UPI0018E53FD7|nr:cytochrome P450 [Oceanicella sp. SM1341]